MFNMSTEVQKLSQDIFKDIHLHTGMHALITKKMLTHKNEGAFVHSDSHLQGFTGFEGLGKTDRDIREWDRGMENGEKR